MNCESEAALSQVQRAWTMCACTVCTEELERVSPVRARAGSVSTSGIGWQQTGTAICHSQRPRHQPNYHALWCPVIRCSSTQSLESASSRHSSD